MEAILTCHPALSTDWTGWQNRVNYDVFAHAPFVPRFYSFTQWLSKHKKKKKKKRFRFSMLLTVYAAMMARVDRP